MWVTVQRAEGNNKHCRTKKIMNEWMNEWMNKWMNKWMNEWMNE